MASLQIPVHCSVGKSKVVITLKPAHNLMTALGVLRSPLASPSVFQWPPSSHQILPSMDKWVWEKVLRSKSVSQAPRQRHYGRVKGWVTGKWVFHNAGCWSETPRHWLCFFHTGQNVDLLTPSLLPKAGERFVREVFVYILLKENREIIKFFRNDEPGLE